METIQIDFSKGPRVWDKVQHVTLFNNDHVCGNCNGSGFRDFRDYCRVCNGTGNISEPVPMSERQLAKAICQSQFQAGTEDQIDVVLAAISSRESLESFYQELQ